MGMQSEFAEDIHDSTEPSPLLKGKRVGRDSLNNAQDHMIKTHPEWDLNHVPAATFLTIPLAFQTLLEKWKKEMQ